MKKIPLFLAFLTLTSLEVFGQNREEFKTRFETITKGNMLIFGNQIVNRKTEQKSANLEYNELAQGMKPNDEFLMEYVDTDKDKSTFSSSTASLFLPVKKTNILFAGLYWSAFYPFERGKMQGKNYIAEDNTRKDFREVQLKLPKQKSYETIKGEVIFDGGMDVNHITKSPYVMFADITSQVKSLKNPAGEYAVANIHAAQGAIEGGSAGGWTIIIVYEDPAEPLRRIDVKDGFAEIGKDHTMITFDRFETPENEETTPRLAGAALDADASVGENRLAVYSPKGGFYMETQTRKVENFFNSSITEDEDHLLDRLPKSLNTLGFDIYAVEIPNYENIMFPQGSTELDVDVTATTDNFYMFLMALSIDCVENPRIPEKKPESVAVEPPVEEVKKEENPMPETPEPPKEVAPEKPTTTKPKTTVGKNKKVLTAAPKKEKVEKEIKTQKAAKKETATKTATNEKTDATEANVRSTVIKGVEKGFYTIMGSFSEEKNAQNFIDAAKKKGVECKKIFNAEKKTYYVYYSFSANYNDALKKQMEFLKLKKEKEDLKPFKDPWILNVKN